MDKPLAAEVVAFAGVPSAVPGLRLATASPAATVAIPKPESEIMRP